MTKEDGTSYLAMLYLIPSSHSIDPNQVELREAAI